jgi:hypothetical protein
LTNFSFGRHRQAPEFDESRGITLVGRSGPRSGSTRQKTRTASCASGLADIGQFAARLAAMSVGVGALAIMMLTGARA